MKNANITYDPQISGSPKTPAAAPLFDFPEFADQNNGAAPQFAAVILDMDGTLLDSMGFWVHFDEIFAQELGYEMTPGMAEEITAMGFRGTARWFIKTFNIDKTEDEMVQLFIDRALSFYTKEAQEKPGAIAYVNKLKDRGVKLVAASSSSMAIVEAGLRRIGVLDLMDALVSCDDLQTTKQEGLVYREAARLVGAPLEHCLVFEDITTALESAIREGAVGCGIYDGNAQQNTPALKAAAHFFIQDFTQLL